MDAYSTSKLVFNEFFLTKQHVEKAAGGYYHTTPYQQRLAIDIMFLSVLEHEATVRGDSSFAYSVMNELMTAMEDLHTDIFSDLYWEGSNAWQTPGLALQFRASVFIKYFNWPRITYSLYQTHINEIYNNSKSYLISSYKTNMGGSGLESGTIQQITQWQHKFPAYGTTTKSSMAVNEQACAAHALAMDSFLLCNDGVPTDYPYRNDISDLGNFLRAMAFADATGTKHLVNTGGAPETLRTDYVSTGYTSWVAMCLSQAAFGTVYTSGLAIQPNSVFNTEANLIKEGFKAAWANLGYMPEYFGAFGDAGTDHKITTNPDDQSPYLYCMSFLGDQSFIDWIDNAVLANAANTSTIHSNTVQPVTGEPIIVSCARADESGGTTGEAMFHRALEGLTGGMIKSLNFGTY